MSPVRVVFDGVNGDWDLLPLLKEVAEDVTIDHTGYEKSVWIEKSLRSLDDVKPDVVITLTDDESFQPDVLPEIEEFWKSDKLGMMTYVRAPMPTSDGRIPINGRRYPPARHMNIYKWREGLSYVPYMGYTQVTQYAYPACQWEAKAEYSRYCMFTPEMEAEKCKRVKKNWPDNPEVHEGW